MAQIEQELGLAPWEQGYNWPYEGDLRGVFRGVNVRVTRSRVPGPSESADRPSESTVYGAYFDEQVIGPSGFRTVGFVKTRLFGKETETVGKTRYTADSSTELQFWLTPERRALLTEIADSQDVRWWAKKNWRLVTLTRWDPPAVGESRAEYLALATSPEAIRNDLDHLIDRIEALQ